MMKNLQGLLSPSKKKRTLKDGADQSNAVDDAKESLHEATNVASTSTPEERKTGRVLRKNVLKAFPRLVDEEGDSPDNKDSPGPFARRRKSIGNAREEDHPSQQLPLSASYDKEEAEKKAGIKDNIRGFFNRRKSTLKKESEEPALSPGASDDINNEDSEVEEVERGYLEEIFKRKQASMHAADEEEQSESQHSSHTENIAADKSRRGRRRSVTKLIAEARKREEEKAGIEGRSPVSETPVIDDNISRRRRRSLNARTFDAGPSPGEKDTNIPNIGNEQKSMRMRRSGVASLDDVRVKADPTERRTRRGRRSIPIYEEGNESEHRMDHGKADPDGKQVLRSPNSQVVTKTGCEPKPESGTVVNDRRTKRGRRTIPESTDGHVFSQSEKTNEIKSRRTRRSFSNRDGGGDFAAERDRLAAGKTKIELTNNSETQVDVHFLTRDNNTSDRRTRRGRRSVDSAFQGDIIQSVIRDGDISENAEEGSLNPLLAEDIEADKIYDSELNQTDETGLLSRSIISSPTRRSPSSRKQKSSAAHLGTRKHLADEPVSQDGVESERELLRANRRPSESSKSFRKDLRREDDQRRLSPRSASKSHLRARSKSRSRARSKSRSRAHSKSRNSNLSPTRRRSRSRIRASNFDDTRERRRSRSRHRPSLSSSKTSNDTSMLKDRHGDNNRLRARDAIRERDDSDRNRHHDRGNNKEEEGSRDRDRYRERERDIDRGGRIKDSYSGREFHYNESEVVSKTARRRSTKQQHSSTVSASSRSHLSDSASSFDSFLQQIRAGNKSSGMEETSRAHATANQVRVPASRRRVPKSKNKLTSYLASDEKNIPKQNLEVRSTFTSLKKSTNSSEIPKSKTEAIALLRQGVSRTRSKTGREKIMDTVKNSPSSKRGGEPISEEANAPVLNDEIALSVRNDDLQFNTVNLEHSESLPLTTVPPVGMNKYNGGTSQLLDQGREVVYESGEVDCKQIMIDPDTSPREKRSRSRRVARTSILDSDIGGEREADILLLSPGSTKTSSCPTDMFLPDQSPSYLAKLSETMHQSDGPSDLLDPNQDGNRENDQPLELHSNHDSDPVSQLPELARLSNLSQDLPAKDHSFSSMSETEIPLKDDGSSSPPKDKLPDCHNASADNYLSVNSQDIDREIKLIKLNQPDSQQKQLEDEEDTQDVSLEPMGGPHVDLVSANQSSNERERANDSDLDSSIESDDEKATGEEERSETLRADFNGLFERDQVEESYHSDIDSAASYRKANKGSANVRESPSIESTKEQIDMSQPSHTKEGEDVSENSYPPTTMTHRSSGGDDSLTPLEKSNVCERLLSHEKAEAHSSEPKDIEMETERQINGTRNPVFIKESDRVTTEVPQSIVQTQDDISNLQQLSNSELVSQDQPSEISHNAPGGRSTGTADTFDDGQGTPSLTINDRLVHIESVLPTESPNAILTHNETAALTTPVESISYPILTHSPSEESYQNSVETGDASPHKRRGPKVTRRSREESSLEPSRENTNIIVSSPVSRRNLKSKRRLVKGIAKKDEKHAGTKPHSRERHDSIHSPQKRNLSPSRRYARSGRTRDTNSPDSKKSSWRPPRLKQNDTDTGGRAGHTRKRHSSRRTESLRGSVKDEDIPVEYNGEDVFMLYSWSGNTQDTNNIQRERLALKKSIRALSLFRAYENIESS